MKKFLFGMFVGILASFQILLKNKEIRNGFISALTKKIEQYAYSNTYADKRQSYNKPRMTYQRPTGDPAHHPQ